MNQLQTPLTWGEQSLPTNTWHQIDRLWLYLTLTRQEFGTSHCYSEPTSRSWLQFTPLVETRYPITGDLIATQRLSGRPVVARPRQPIHLPAGEQAVLYVGTSLWFQLARDKDVLLDVPVSRLSDTWFGINTMVGEICYACETHARLTMDGVRVNPFKAITPIAIHNQTSAPMLIDKVKIPVPHLSLYRGADRHWTSQLTITRTDSDATSKVHVDQRPPAMCRSPVELSAPRLSVRDGILTKAMGLLLG